MSLFVCAKCGCVDNTATSSYWMLTNEYMVDKFEYAVDSFPYVGDNIGAAKVLRELADKNLLILYTVRDGKYLQDAVDWFRYNHINLYSVNYNPEPVSSSPKVYCDYYIDDRNIGTPLTDKGYVDWDKMLVLLRQKNLL